MIFVLLILGIFASSTRVEYYVIASLMRATRSRKVAMRVFAVMFLPGTVLHEVAHWLMALLLGVRSSGPQVFPRIEGDKVIMGEVRIERTDMFRRLLIGAAPFLFGLPLTLLLVYRLGETGDPWWLKGLLVYLVFQTINTSFASAKDMEGILVAITAFVLAVAFAQLSGVPVWDWAVAGLGYLARLDSLAMVNGLLAIPLSINLSAWVLARILLK